MMVTGTPTQGCLGMEQNYTSYDGLRYTNQNQYSSATYYNGSNSLNFPSTLSNSGLKPYTVKSDEVGMDVRFMENRLGLDVTYFRNLNGPSITPLAIDPATGFYTKNQNALTTQKKGLEITIQGNPVRTENFRWDILANWSTFRETLYSIGQGLTSIGLNGHNYTVGQRMDAFYSTDGESSGWIG